MLEFPKNSRYITTFQNGRSNKRVYGYNIFVTISETLKLLEQEKLLMIFQLLLKCMPNMMGYPLFELLPSKVLTLNWCKSFSSKEHLEYFGFIFWKVGEKPSDCKIRVLREAEHPKDGKKVYRYFWMHVTLIMHLENIVYLTENLKLFITTKPSLIYLVEPKINYCLQWTA